MIPLVSECITLGTTDEIITAFISSAFIFLTLSQSQKNIPYSSEVLEIPVVIRNVYFKSLSSNNPTVMLVFPTSIANNILFSSHIYSS